MTAILKTTSVWAMLHMANESERQLQAFFIEHERLKPRLVRTGLHLTVYHARRPMGLPAFNIPASIHVAPQALRLMVMAPGGENPRPEHDPAGLNVGVRLQRADPGCQAILELREQFYPYETPEVLGPRPPSTARSSAFGSHHYQPHVTLLRPKSGIDRDLANLGDRLRAAVPAVCFDRLIVSTRTDVRMTSQ